MRATRATIALLAFVSTGCLVVSSNGLSNGGTAKRPDSGATSTGGAAPGASCASNDMCNSGICGLAGAGNCCFKACATTDPICGASRCDDGGACIYPSSGLDCGATSCSDDAQAQPQCDGLGGCSAEGLMLCPFDTTCNDAGTACNSTCSSSAECLKGFSCNGGVCVTPEPIGPCSENDDCLSGICGIHGTGHCCTGACSSDLPCGASDCALSTGDCNYAPNSMACGQSSCDGGVIQTPFCDGIGGCESFAQTVECVPFACNAGGCLTTCTSNDACADGYCDLPSSTCCGLASGAQMFVDPVTGADVTCCGGKSAPCQTLTHAMHLIDQAQARDVVITPSDNGLPWDPPGETYPIVLGWGVELNAAHIHFDDGDGGNRALFEIGPVSASDQIGYASIVGGFFGLPMPIDQSTILVEPESTLYIAGAAVYSSLADHTTAIEVSAKAGLVLGQDRSGGQVGTVFIGYDPPDSSFEGYNGIVCDSANGFGCTIADVPGAGSVVIVSQANHDIDAEDFALITLGSSAQVGALPIGIGRTACPSQVDGWLSSDAAILIHGKATVTIDALVQCIGGTAIALEASANGAPSLTTDGIRVKNATVGLYASAGTATIANSWFEYNTIGVEQGTDGINIASIDLSGGTIGGTNTIACNTSGDGGMIGASVINLTSGALDASHVAWDTPGPDVFNCDAFLTSCTCAISSCTDSPGADGMDAVMVSIGAILTTGNVDAPDCVQ